MRILACVVTLVGLAVVLGGGCTRAPEPPPPAPGSDLPVAAGGLTGELVVHVPCGMIIPVRAVMDRFRELHPGVEVRGVFDNPGVLAERIVTKGEKADVFISPGEAEIGRLEEAGLLDETTRRSIGSFELVVITQRDSLLALSSPADLAQCKTISVPDPAINSVGASGKEALEKLGLWEDLRPKMVLTNHAIQSHTMVANGKSQAGIAYRNCPLETNPEKLSPSKVTVAFSFPADSYRPQPCIVAALKDNANPAAAHAFIELMASEEGRRILDEKGMTGCLDGLVDTGARPSAGDAAVTVRAFYPDNEGHAHVKKLILGLNDKHPGKVHAEFIDFTSDEGFEKWQAAGLSCGAVLINDEMTWTYERDGAPVQVTFKMALGGEWTEDDLHAVIESLPQPE